MTGKEVAVYTRRKSVDSEDQLLQHSWNWCPATILRDVRLDKEVCYNA